ncbi:hypothetical protein DEJ24_15825, partial [Curtobacterium sp. MCPF17_001]
MLDAARQRRLRHGIEPAGDAAPHAHRPCHAHPEQSRSATTPKSPRTRNAMSDGPVPETVAGA